MPKLEAAKSPWREGLGLALPVVLGYLPIGFALGVLAVEAGLGPVDATLMSLLVFAGASQFIAVDLLAAGAAAWSIILTTLLVNLRHVMMASALVPHLRDWRAGERALFAFELTDETFAVHAVYFSRAVPSPPVVRWANILAHAAWLAGTALGALLGQALPGVDQLPLDYALPALFVALLVFQIQDRLTLCSAAVGGLLAVILQALGVKAGAVLPAAAGGALAGALLERWSQKRSS